MLSLDFLNTSSQAARRKETQLLQAQVQELKQEVDSSRSKTSKLQCELGSYRAECQQLTQKIQLLESRCRQAEQQYQEATDVSQQLRRVCRFLCRV